MIVTNNKTNAYHCAFQVPLGVILKSENKTDEMCEIMEITQQYVPHVQASHDFVNPMTEDVINVMGDHFCRVLFGGDQLSLIHI